MKEIAGKPIQLKNPKKKIEKDFLKNQENEFTCQKTEKGDFIVKLWSVQSVFIEGCFLVRVISTNASLNIGGVFIDSSFYKIAIPIYSFPGFPNFEIKLTENASTEIESFAELIFTPIRKFENNFFTPFVFPTTNISVSFLKKANKSFLNSDCYHSVCLSLYNRLVTLKDSSEASIFIYGEKNCGKSTLANFVLNYFINKFEFCQTNFIDLDIGKTTFDSIGFISQRNFKHPFFINAVNSLIATANSEEDTLEFVGENSPQFNPPFYLEKIAEVLAKKIKPANNKLKINVINHLGFFKGQGKFLLESIKSILPGTVFIVKIDRNAVITVKEHNKNVLLDISLHDLNYHIHNPHFFQERRLSLVSAFLFENKNIIKFSTKEASFKVISASKVEYFYKSMNYSLLELVFASSVVEVSIVNLNKSKKSYLGLFLCFEQNNDFVCLNLPFFSWDENCQLPFIEITKSSYLDFGIEKSVSGFGIDKEITQLPFMGIKGVGVGSKVLRKKVSKRA